MYAHCRQGPMPSEQLRTIRPTQEHDNVSKLQWRKSRMLKRLPVVLVLMSDKNSTRCGKELTGLTWTPTRAMLPISCLGNNRVREPQRRRFNERWTGQQEPKRHRLKLPVPRVDRQDRRRGQDNQLSHTNNLQKRRLKHGNPDC